MKKCIFYLLTFSSLLVSCQKEISEGSVAPEIIGEIVQTQTTRTQLSVDEYGDGIIYWTPSDRINIFFGKTGMLYTSQNTENAYSAVFCTSENIEGKSLDVTNIWGLYPYNSTAACDGTTVTTTLPSSQYGVPDTFDDDLYITLAHSSSPSLAFYNVCSGIKFSLSRDDIKSISFKGNDNEYLAGDISLSFENGLPKSSVINGSKEITLSPKSGQSFLKDTNYYIVTLPTTLSKGFTMTFTTTDGNVGTLNYEDKLVTLNRAIFSKKALIDLFASFKEPSHPNNIIYYTSSDEKIVKPYKTDVFGANIVSNEYINGRGVITFDGDVTSLGDYAFFQCTNLSTITIPEGVIFVGSYAFYECSNLLTFSVPEGVTSIGAYAFATCSNLSSLSLPESVLSIGRYAFSSTGIISLTIPGHVTTIPQNLCSYCHDLTSVTLRDGVEVLEHGAFSGCSSLSTINIPSSVFSIGSHAFGSCSILKSIILPSSVSVIGVGAFQSSGLSSIIIPEGVTTIEDYTFRECSSLVSVEFRGAIETIGNYAFRQCSNLSSITFPQSVTSIKDWAFAYCTSLTSITIPESVTNIGGQAFRDCSGLKTITVLPTIPPALSVQTFEGTNNIPIYVPASSVAAYKSAQSWSEYASRIQAIPQSTTRIYYTSTDGVIVTPNKTNCFGANLISNEYKDGIGVLSFDNDVTTIGEDAFSNCQNLASITLTEGVTTIGNNAFKNCSGLSIIVIPVNVKTVGNFAFYGCTSLLSVKIPDGVISIGNSSFAGCTSLNSLTIPGSVIDIGEFSFAQCSSVSTVTIPGSISVISGYAFYECNSLTSVIINEGVSRIAGYAFAYCSTLSSVSIPGSVIDIGIRAFDHCSDLPLITIPEKVTSIGARAFEYCYSLSSITIPENVTTIGSQAFNYCYGLLEIKCLPNTPPAGGGGMFSSTYCPIYVPAESVDTYKTTQYWSSYSERIQPLAPLPSAIDLGLSVKWASFNLGATKPEEYGDYYAWGETEPKEEYSWDTYKMCNGSNVTLTKYNTISTFGYVDNKTVLDLEDDAAFINWGETWRMPTQEEMLELYNNTTSVWTTENGVLGRRFISKVEGHTDKSIFLPAAGYREGSSLTISRKNGSYWSSSLKSDHPDYSMLNMSFFSSDVYLPNSQRFYGYSIRPVCK